MKLEKSVLENGVTIIKLTGRLDIQGAGEIETQFAAEAVANKAAVLVDMSAVEFIASIGIRLLLVNAKALDSQDGKMGLLTPQPLVKEALEMAGIDSLIPFYDDQEAGAAAVLAAVA